MHLLLRIHLLQTYAQNNDKVPVKLKRLAQMCQKFEKKKSLSEVEKGISTNHLRSKVVTTKLTPHSVYT